MIEQPSISEMVSKAADAVGLPPDELEIATGRRSEQVSRARWAIMLALNERRRLSLSLIGQHLGGLDHTSVLYGLRRARELRARDKAFAAMAHRAAVRIRPHTLDFGPPDRKTLLRGRPRRIESAEL